MTAGRTGCLFLLPVVILFGAYIVFQVWPFGRALCCPSNLNAQYVYYYDYMYDVFAGDESIWYSWSETFPVSSWA